MGGRMEVLLSRLEDHIISFHKELELNYARKSVEVLCRILLKNANNLSENHTEFYGRNLLDKLKPEMINVSKNHKLSLKSKHVFFSELV